MKRKLKTLIAGLIVMFFLAITIPLNVMQFVPVVDINQRPLMPTTPSRARRWMKKIGPILVIFVVVLLLTLTSPLLGIAQNPTQPELLQNQTQPENKIDGFPVILDGKPLLFIRRGIASFSAEAES